MQLLPEPALLWLVARIVGLAIVGGGLAATAAAIYRWYAGEQIPLGLPVLLSLVVVALYLSTTDALQAVIGGYQGVFDLHVVFVNVITFAAAGAVAPAGVRIGDRFGAALFALGGRRAVDGEMSRFVKAVGRVLTVKLPEEITDIEGYDPVPPETKADLTGKTLTFPRRLTVEELRDRFVARLKDDYGVGHVDVELTDDGSVEYLAVGSRAAGVGPTLPSGTVAVAIHADPAFAASPGDQVQIWRPDDPPAQVAMAELRGTAGNVVTVALDEADAASLNDATRYRLVTLPGTPSAEREFAGLLRAADETMDVVTVPAGGELVGTPVSALDVTIVAVRPDNGPVEALPKRSRTLDVGDTVYAIARPEPLRRFVAANRRRESDARAKRDGVSSE